jgi:hypothetical protein
MRRLVPKACSISSDIVVTTIDGSSQSTLIH